MTIFFGDKKGSAGSQREEPSLSYFFLRDFLKAFLCT